MLRLLEQSPIWIILTISAALLAGCAAPPERTGDDGPIVFPKPPDEPRFVFERTIVGTGAEQMALVVPKDAVLVRPDGSTVWVAVPEQNPETTKAHPVPVTIAIRMEQEYAVEPETPEGRERLVPGVQVVIEGAERLTPGQQVDIVKLDGE